MKHFQLLFILLFCLFLNCQKENQNQILSNQNKVELESDSNKKLQESVQSREIVILKPQPFTKDFLKIDEVEINGHQLIISENEFNTMYPTKKDSVKTELWECGSPFEWIDKDWMIKTYGQRNSESGTFEKFDGKITSIYTNNAEFNTNKHIVLFNTASTDKNSFRIKSNNILLDQNTTIDEFQKLFPNLKKEILDHKKELRFRISSGFEMEDSFLFYFKNGKLHKFELWWLLC